MHINDIYHFELDFLVKPVRPYFGHFVKSGNLWVVRPLQNILFRPKLSSLVDFLEGTGWHPNFLRMAILCSDFDKIANFDFM